MIMPFFELEVLDYIREPEVDALFIHFMNEFKDPDDNLKFVYWECIKLHRRKKLIQNLVMIKKCKNLHTEVTKNPLLLSRFLPLSLTLFAKMLKGMIKILESKEVAVEFSEVVFNLEKCRSPTWNLMNLQNYISRFAVLILSTSLRCGQMLWR